MSLTRYEALALATLSGLFIIGILARHVQQRAVPVPAGAYDELDRMFFARVDSLAKASAATGHEDPVETTHAGSTPRARPMLPGSTAPPEAASAPASYGMRIDVNHADVEALQTLPRIGPKTAERIIAFRDAYGPFHSVEDLQQIRGIGPRTIEQLRPLVSVSPRSPPPRDRRDSGEPE